MHESPTQCRRDSNRTSIRGAFTKRPQAKCAPIMSTPGRELEVSGAKAIDSAKLIARQGAGARVSSSQIERLSATLARRPLVVGQRGVARGVAGRPLVVGRRTLAARSHAFRADPCPA